MKIIFKTLIAFLLIQSNSIIKLTAQEDYSPSKIISFTPQYMINKGLMMNIDKKLQEGKWLQISPQLYFANDKNSNGGDNYNDLAGVGINVHKKIFVSSSPEFLKNEVINESGIYLSYGPSYNFIHLNYYDDNETNATQYSTSIHKIGGDVLLGYQFLVKEIVSIDLYAGMGLRYSFINTDGEKTNLFNDSMFGFGYTGNLIQMGVRIGISL